MLFSFPLFLVFNAHLSNPSLASKILLWLRVKSFFPSFEDNLFVRFPPKLGWAVRHRSFGSRSDNTFDIVFQHLDYIRHDRCTARVICWWINEIRLTMPHSVRFRHYQNALQVCHTTDESAVFDVQKMCLLHVVFSASPRQFATLDASTFEASPRNDDDGTRVLRSRENS